MRIQPPRVVVTTSWDDGHRLDPRLADLLRAHALPATFYVAPRNRELAAADRLTGGQILDLAQDFEIGSHTLTHPVLTRLSPDDVRRELVDSRQHLEDLTGRAVPSFCYPRGAHDATTVRAVRLAGYSYARTVRRFDLTAPADGDRFTARFTAGTALEAHRGPLPHLHRDAVRLLRLANGSPVRAARLLDWERLARLLFDEVLERGGVFHLWGHSWVVDEAGDWERLDRVLGYVAGRPGVTYVPNAGLVTAVAAAGGDGA